MRTTTCPGCRHEVPSGRWCNRCGAAMEQPAVTVPSGQWTGRAVAAGLVGALALGAIAVGIALDGGPAAPLAADGLDDTAVVLAEDPPAPPAPSPLAARPALPATPPGERVDVICSDLRIRSVPTTQVDTDEPGALVELANGTCVVMGPNGAVAP